MLKDLSTERTAEMVGLSLSGFRVRPICNSFDMVGEFMAEQESLTKDRRRFLKRLAVGAGLAAPVLVTLADRKVVAQTGGPTPTQAPE